MSKREGGATDQEKGGGVLKRACYQQEIGVGIAELDVLFRRGKW